MTSIAFIAGVLPLALASGAGAEMRQAMGIAVFGGMIGVTLFGLILTPAFFKWVRRLSRKQNGQLIAQYSRATNVVEPQAEA